jgi:RHS repeat-associated protein
LVSGKVGNWSAVGDGIGRWTFTYDAVNQRKTTTDPASNTITYSYSGIGQRVGLVASQIGQFTYAYDPRGQISHLINPQGDRTTFSYDSAARRTLTELANGARTSYTYDAASRVQQLYNLKADASVILGLTYEHDPVGNPTSMLESTGDRVTWTYDATDRLTREQRSGESAYDTTYTYDPLGNRLVTDASNARTSYTYDLANQLTTSQDAAGTTTYTYDLAGNLHVVEQPTGARTTTTWDDQNRQTGVIQPTGAVTTCTYRCDGLRHSKKDSAATTKFIWDFENYLAETNAADEIQGIYTNEPQRYGNLISQYRKGPTIWLPSYYHYDALGSTRVLTDEGGSATDTYLYDAWGNELAVTGSTVNSFRWVGQVGYYWDEATGTFYIRARVYEPVTGRWMSPDPIPLDTNLYAYVVEAPVAFVDPSGLKKCAVNCRGLAAQRVEIGYLDASEFFLHINRGPPIETSQKKKATGIGWTVDFFANERAGGCCCDEFRFIQVMISNQETPEIAVDTKPGATEPWYPGQSVGPYTRQAGFPDSGRAIPSTVSMYDKPNIPAGFKPRPGKSKTIVASAYVACIVCVRTNPRNPLGTRDEILDCVKYGHERRRNLAVSSWGPILGFGPQCVQAGESWKDALTNNQVIGGAELDYDEGEEFFQEEGRESVEKR